MPKMTISADLMVYLCIITYNKGLISKQGLTLEWGLQTEVLVKFIVEYKFPNLIKMTHIFPIKKGRGSFEKKPTISQ